MTEIIFTGRRTVTGGKTGYCFITVAKFNELIEKGLKQPDTIEQWSSPFAAMSKASFPKVVAGVLETDHDLKVDDQGRMNSINYGKLKFVRMMDTDLIANWRILDDIVEQEKRVKSFIKKQEENTRLDHAVQILKQHYKSVSPGYRRSFQLWLLNELDRK